MALNVFDDDAVQRIGNVVRQVEAMGTKAPPYRRARNYYGDTANKVRSFTTKKVGRLDVTVRCGGWKRVGPLSTMCYAPVGTGGSVSGYSILPEDTYEINIDAISGGSLVAGDWYLLVYIKGQSDRPWELYPEPFTDDTGYLDFTLTKDFTNFYPTPDSGFDISGEDIFNGYREVALLRVVEDSSSSDLRISEVLQLHENNIDDQMIIPDSFYCDYQSNPQRYTIGYNPDDSLHKGTLQLHNVEKVTENSHSICYFKSAGEYSGFAEGELFWACIDSHLPNDGSQVPQGRSLEVYNDTPYGDRFQIYNFDEMDSQYYDDAKSIAVRVDGDGKAMVFYKWAVTFEWRPYNLADGTTGPTSGADFDITTGFVPYSISSAPASDNETSYGHFAYNYRPSTVWDASLNFGSEEVGQALVYIDRVYSEDIVWDELYYHDQTDPDPSGLPDPGWDVRSYAGGSLNNDQHDDIYPQALIAVTPINNRAEQQSFYTSGWWRGFGIGLLDVSEGSAGTAYSGTEDNDNYWTYQYFLVDVTEDIYIHCDKEVLIEGDDGVIIHSEYVAGTASDPSILLYASHPSYSLIVLKSFHLIEHYAIEGNYFKEGKVYIEDTTYVGYTSSTGALVVDGGASFSGGITVDRQVTGTPFVALFADDVSGPSEYIEIRCNSSTGGSGYAMYITSQATGGSMYFANGEYMMEIDDGVGMNIASNASYYWDDTEGITISGRVGGGIDVGSTHEVKLQDALPDDYVVIRRP